MRTIIVHLPIAVEPPERIARKLNEDRGENRSG